MQKKYTKFFPNFNLTEKFIKNKTFFKRQDQHKLILRYSLIHLVYRISNNSKFFRHFPDKNFKKHWYQRVYICLTI